MEQNEWILTPIYLERVQNHTSAILIQSELDHYAKIKLSQSLGIRRTFGHDRQGEVAQGGRASGTLDVCGGVGKQSSADRRFDPDRRPGSRHGGVVSVHRKYFRAGLQPVER